MKLLKQILLIIFFLTSFSCGKNYLDIKRQANQVVPLVIEDYQAILDQNNIMIEGPSVGLGLIGSDEYYVHNQQLKALNQAYERNAYLWNSEIFEGHESLDWNWAYQRILYANMALEVRKIEPKENERKEWENVVGSALFFRAYNYYQLAQLFCKPYNHSTAKNDHGVPLKLDYDVTIKTDRSTVHNVYQTIITDLEKSIELLPSIAINKFRPGRVAAYFLLSKVYMNMGDYTLAESNADAALKIYDRLLDFNDLDKTFAFSFPYDHGISNPEIILFSKSFASILDESRMNVDTLLLEMYEENDLRKKTYYREHNRGGFFFKGSYASQPSYFVGLATDELWLIRAESRVKNGKIQDGLDDLNHLLKHRYKLGSYIHKSHINKDEALAIIMDERRKELFLRGTRWEDLRRYNNEGYNISIEREFEGVKFLLAPGDLKWVWPIPDNEIELSEIPQNER